MPAVKAEQTKIINLPCTVLGFDISADASQGYAACMDGAIYQVDLKTGDHKLLYHHDNSFASGVNLIPGTSTLISSGYNGEVQWFDLEKSESIRKVSAHKFWSWQAAVSDDGKYFASVTGQYLAGGLKYEPAPETEPSVKVFDTATGKIVHAFSHVPSVQAVAFSPDNQYVCAGNLMGETRVWELATGKQLAAFTTSAMTSWGIIKVHAYQGGIYSMMFSPNSESIVVCGMGQMRDPNTGNGKQTWQRFNWKQKGSPRTAQINENDAGGGHPEALAFHPDKSYFVMSGRLAQGKWNTGFFDDKTGAMINSLDCKGRITKAKFDADGKQLFLAGGVGQPKAKDGNYPPFGRVFVYSIA